MNYRKLLPWLPLIGIPFTAMAHLEHGDTGLENPVINAISAIWQAVSISGAVLIIAIA